MCITSKQPLVKTMRRPCARCTASAETKLLAVISFSCTGYLTSRAIRIPILSCELKTCPPRTNRLGSQADSMEIERKTVDTPDRQRQTELGVTRQYAQTHGWVVHALAGWLSAYYMEDPRFRVLRRFHDVETGHEVWICEHEGDFPAKRLIARLRAD